MEIEKIKITELMEEMQEGFWILDKTGKIIFVNPAGMNMFGFEKNEKLGKNIFDFIEDTSARLRSMTYLPKLLIGEKIKDEMDLKKKDGTPIKVKLSAYPIKDEIGKVVGVSLYIDDITNSDKLNKEIKAVGENYRNILDNSLEGILILDLRGKIVWANKLARSLYGTGTLEETKGYSIMKFVDTLSLPFATIDLAKAIAGINVGLKEYLTISMEGKKYWMETISKIVDFEGQKVLFVTFRDVSERKKTEEVLKSKLEELEKLNKFMVNRELKMVELKNKIEELENKTASVKCK